MRKLQRTSKGSQNVETHNMTAHKNKKMSNTDPIKNSVVNLGYFRLFITNWLYNLIKYTICILIQQCKPCGGYQTLDRRCWLFCITTYRSRRAWRPRIIRYRYFVFYWIYVTLILIFLSDCEFFQLPLFSISFYLCQTIHARNNKTKILARNNETKKHASFKLTFRNMD